MTEIKVGDRVYRDDPDECIHVANKVTGTVMQIEIVGGRKIVVIRDDKGNQCRYGHAIETYKKVERTMEDLRQGDILVIDGTDRLEVQGTMGKIVFTIDITSDDEESCDYSIEELKRNGYELKTETEITEMTLEEVAKMKGVPVEQLRIKE